MILENYTIVYYSQKYQIKSGKNWYSGSVWSHEHVVEPLFLSTTDFVWGSIDPPLDLRGRVIWGLFARTQNR